MEIKVIYEDENVLVADKPAGVTVQELAESQTPKYDLAHRLDKDTSGVLMLAKNAETLLFLQKQYKNREVEKKYVCLAEGSIKQDEGVIQTKIGRSPMDMRKQKAYSPDEQAPASARDAVTEYKVLQRFKDYTLLEVKIKTGRRHQIRCHLAYMHHPVAGDKLYRFKNSPVPAGLTRQFLHAKYIKIRLPDGKVHEFESELPDELNNILTKL